MYALPLPAILRILDLPSQGLTENGHVIIPMSLFRFLLQIVLIDCDFDEADYLSANPDVADAVRNGIIKDARLHYAMGPAR